MSDCSLLIFTCLSHAHWLVPCLASINKFCTGISEIVMAVAAREVEELKARAIPTKIPLRWWTFDEIDGHGFNHHQALTCCADLICTTNFVVHFDIDCLWTESVDVRQEYFYEGKPILLIEPYKNLAWHSGVMNWKVTTEKALEFPCEFETMRRHPAVHHRWAYRFLRDYIEDIHGLPIVDFFVAQPERVGISEFNVIGAFALEMFPEAYAWLDVTLASRPKDKLNQYVSYRKVPNQ